MMNKSILLFAATALLGTAARAEDPPAPPFTANIAVTTNYKFRGQDQGSLTPTKAVRPAVQGGFDWTMDGFYLGNWNSSIGWLPGASVEMDFYGGYKGEFAKDVTYDVGILRYQYIGGAVGNTTELYVAGGFGPTTLKYSHTISSDYFGFGSAGIHGPVKGRNTGYLDLSSNVPIVDLITLNGHIGYTRFASEIRDNVNGSNGSSLPNYFDYKIGVTYDLSKMAGSGVSLAGAIVGASKKASFTDSTGTSINKARLIVTLSKAL